MVEQDIPTFIERFYHWEKTTPDNVYLRQPIAGVVKNITYKEAGLAARKMVTALRELGLEPGDNIGIYSKNCYHWVLADLAIIMGGYVSVPYYSSLPGAQLAQVVKLSDIKAIFIGKLEHWTEAHINALANVITIKTPAYKGFALVETGLDWDELVSDAGPMAEDFIPKLDDVWTIKFTSGTTGTPKGVMHSHRSLANTAVLGKKHRLSEVYEIEHPRTLSYLPLNHVGERMGILLITTWQGGTITFNESVETFARDIQATQPHIFFAVPRIWTHMYQGVISKIAEEQLNELLANPATAEGIKTQIRTQLGFRDLKVCATGAAITPASLKQFYKTLDITLIEAYGMTETCGTIANSTDPDCPLDSVGKAVPWAEIKIDPESGEVLFKTAVMMLGYYNAPDATASVLSEDGWLKSGDRGNLDENGCLRIIGRVNDAFKTTKGSYVTPNPLEETLVANEYIEQVCVVGLGNPQPLALVNLSPLGLRADRKDVEESLLEMTAALNKTRANYERISTVIIQTEMWSAENGLLTPTLKLKRYQFDTVFGPHYLDWHNSSDDVIWSQG